MASAPPSTPFPPAQHAQLSAHGLYTSTTPAQHHLAAPPSSSPSAFATAVSRASASVSPPTFSSGAHAGVLSATQQTMQGTFDNPLIPKKRRRTTPAELAILEHEFRANNRPDPLERARMAERLGMTARAVQVWYQNRRQKEKKESSSSSIASSGSDPRDLDGVLLSFSSSPLPSPALSLHASASASGEAPKGVLVASQELYSGSPASSASSSTGSNKENSYFSPMPLTATMPASSCNGVATPALLAASAANTTITQPYQYSYPSAGAAGGVNGATMDTGVNADGTPSVYIHRAHNASIIAAKKHVRKRPQGSHAPLARVPSLPHTFVFPPSPVKPSSSSSSSSSGSAGVRTAMARKASLNDVAARQQKKAAATAGLFAHAQGETVAAAAQRRRSSTPVVAPAPAPAPATAAAAPSTVFSADELAPFASTQASSLATLTPASKAKAKDDLLRHMESDPPSASSPAPLTRRRMMAHEASMHDEDTVEEEDEDDLADSATLPPRPAPTRSVSASFPESGPFTTASSFPRPSSMGRTVSLGSFPVYSRTSASVPPATFSGTGAHSPIFDSVTSSRAGAGRSCAVEALGRKRARILETQAAAPVPVRAPSTRPSTSAYATQAKALGLTTERGLGLTLDLAAGARRAEPAQAPAPRKRRRVSAESTASTATDEDSFADLSFSSTSTASTVDSLVTVADSPSSGYFAFGAAAKQARAAESVTVKSPEDEQRECAELLLGLGGFC